VSAGWDAAVERLMGLVDDHAEAVERLTEQEHSYHSDDDALRRLAKATDSAYVVLRDALTAAVGPGGLILEAEDVADLRTILADVEASLPSGRNDLDRLQALLGEREGAG